MNWKNIVRTVAPTIGAALGGPMAGMAVKHIADKWLGEPGATEEDVAEAVLNATPEQMIRLKELDQGFKLQMRQMDIDVFALEVKDRESARTLFGINIWPQIGLSALFIVAYFCFTGMLIALVLPDIGEWQRSMLALLIGILTGEIPRIMGFWFGSSLGSKEKTADIKSART